MQEKMTKGSNRIIWLDYVVRVGFSEEVTVKLSFEWQEEPDQREQMEDYFR